MKSRLDLSTLAPSAARLERTTLLLCALLTIMTASGVFRNGRLTDGWLVAMLFVQTVVLAPLAGIAAYNVTPSHRVLMARVAPLAAWRSEVQQVCIRVFMAWLMTSACLLSLTFGLRLMGYASAPQVAEAVDYCGLTALSMALFATVFSARMWPLRLSFSLTLTVTFFSILAMLAVRVVGPRNLNTEDFPITSTAVGAALLLLSLVVLYRYAVLPLRSQPGSPNPRVAWWIQQLRDLFRRPYLDGNTQPLALLPVFVLVALALQFGHNEALYSLWGEDITAWNLLRVFILASYASHFVASRDLHVRKLLAPGGVFRQGLGQRVTASTLLEVALVAVVLAVGIEFAIWTLPSSLKTLGNMFTLSSALPLASEAVLAVCLATLVRGHSPSSPTAAHLLIVAVLITTGALLWAMGLMTPLRHVPGFGSVGVAYVAALLALAAALTAASNRVWARADLAGLYRKQQSPDTPLDQISNALWGVANRPSSEALRRFLKGNR